MHELPSDPLAKKALTWEKLEVGPQCRRCKSFLERGHRYYSEEGGTVIHYSCRAAEDYEFAVLGF